MKNKKKSSKTTIRKLYSFMSGYTYILFFSIFLGLIRVASALYLPILTANAIDKMIGIGHVDFIAIKGILIKMLICIAITVVSQFLMGICNNRITANIVRNLRCSMIQKIQKIPFKTMDKFNRGDLMSRMVADTDQIGDGLLLGFSQFFVSIFTIVFTLFFMLRMNWIITIVVVVLTPISFFVASFIARRSYNMFTKQSITRASQTALINEIIPNEQLVHAYSYEEEAKKRFDKINDKLSGYALRATFYSSITNPSTRFVNNIIYAVVGVLGAVFTIKGIISVGILSGFLSYANQYTKPFNDISSVITELQNALACAERVFEFLELEDEEDIIGERALKGETSSDGKEVKASKEKSSDKKAKKDSQHVMIESRDLTFGYDENTTVLNDLDFKVIEGQKCAIVGSTGCGKTTIINLIMRFYEPNSGDMYYEGDAISKLHKDFLRSKIGMVLQDTWIAGGTIAYNISFGKPDATMDEIVAAAKSCYAHSFIKRLPDGYDTVVSESGNNLSAGQKQLLCIARVMLVKPELLILDEATSNIDTLTEIKVVKAFDKLMENRTSIIVAHRLQTILNADKIFVMDKGRIVEEGTHEDLLKKNGLYSSIYQSRFGS